MFSTFTGMTRPLRLEFPGALYHVTSRGNRGNPIYRHDADRYAWLNILDQVCKRHRFVIHSFCQMTNHYHLLIETKRANLSRGMRQLNGHYSQLISRRYELVGHLFQGRYKAILVQKESHLLEVSRYIVLNPLRAGMVSSLDEWPWTSHHYLIGARHPPAWFKRDWLLSQFAKTQADAIAAYHGFVQAGVGQVSPLAGTRHGVLLGNDDFVSAHQQSHSAEEFAEAARIERQAITLTLADYQARYADRDEAMARAYLSTAFTMPHIARAFDVSTRTVSRAVAAFEKLIKKA